MTILPSTQAVNGQLSGQIVYIDTATNLSDGHTGSIIALDSSTGAFDVTLPQAEYTGSASIYFVLVAGSNTVTILPEGEDEIEAGEGKGYGLEDKKDMIHLRSDGSDLWNIVSIWGNPKVYTTSSTSTTSISTSTTS